MELKDILWIEKYRPKTLDEMVLSNELKLRFSDVIKNPTRMPHFIFIGIQGTGKTTLARILIDSIIRDKSDVLEINGSDQRGIDVFRTLIPEFLSTPPLLSPIKIVFIDEGDNMTSDAKKIFRALLEKYHKYGRFIITANDDTFTSAIKSRFEIIKFTKLDKDYILEFCKKILESENVEYTEENLRFIVNTFYPDTRKIVGTLQQNSVSGKLETNIISISSEDHVVKLLVDLITYCLQGDSRSANMILITLSKYVTDVYVDFQVVYKTLFEKLSYKAVPLKVVISKFTNRTVNCISPIMLFYEFIYELKNTAEKLKNILYPNDIIEG